MTAADHPSSAGRRRRWPLALVATLFAVLSGALALTAEPAPAVLLSQVTEPTNIAHGGAQGHAPGNTLEAFALALEQGADALEMDAQLTADGEVVLIHDGTVDRTTDGTGAVADMTLDELQELDAGHRFEGPDGDFPYRGTGVRIPTLDGVFAAFPDIPMIIELKTDSGPGIVPAVADRVRAHGREDDVVVASFSLDYIREFRELLPGVPTNMPEAELRDFYVRQLLGVDRWWSPPGEFLQVPEVHEGLRVVTPGTVAAAHRRGTAMQVWTVNEAEDMNRLLNLGVDGIMTDYPDRLEAVVAGREAAERDGVDPSAHRGLGFVQWLHERAGVLTPFARAVTSLGDIEFYVLVFPFVYWSLQRRLGIVTGVALLLSAGLNFILKLAFHTARPEWIDPSLALRPESTFGIPSGHAQNGVVVWGVLAAEARTRAVWTAAIALMLALGWSRVQLGAHFVEDTLVGWVVGALLLAAILRWRAPVGAWIAARSPRQQRWLAFGASVALIAAGGAVRLLASDWVVPGSWIGVDPTEPPMSLESIVTTAAALFGFGAGIVFVRVRGGFDTAGGVLRRLLRYVVGLVGVAAIFLGLDGFLPDGGDPVALVYRYVQFSLLGFWIGGLAPLTFVRLGLAPRADETTRPVDVGTGAGPWPSAST